jgi:hypothetical protein
MRRKADDGIRPHDTARVLDRQIVLTDVDAAGAGKPRDIRAVVDDQGRAGILRAPHEILRERETRLARMGLVAQLQEAGAAAETGVRQRARVDPMELAERDVDDRIERAQTASARPALPLFFGTA